MLKEAQIKSVALFFFFAFQNESLAKQATVKVLRMCKKRLTKDKMAEDNFAPVIIHNSHLIWKKFSKRKNQPQNALNYEAGWLVPEGVDIGLWKQFHKDADPDEFLAVIWSRILKFTDEEIAEGMAVTVGTVRHRVGRGLRLLGQLMNRTGAKS